MKATSPIVAAAAMVGGIFVVDVIGTSPAAQLAEAFGVTTRVSEFTFGAQGDPGDNNDNIMPSISDDGRFLAFAADAAYEDEDPSDEGFTNNRHPDIYIRDRDIDGNGIYDEPPVPGSDPEFPIPQVSTEIVTMGVEQPPPPDPGPDDGVSLRAPRVPVPPMSGFARPAVRAAAPGDDESSNGLSTDPDISGDGIFVAFTSTATNLIADTPDPTSDLDVYRWNRTTDTMELVSQDVPDAPTIAAPIFGSAAAPSISADGQHVAFLNSGTRIFIRDFSQAAQPYYVEVPTLGLGNESHARPHISGDGRQVIFIATGNDPATGQPVRRLAYHDRDPNGDGLDREIETAFLDVPAELEPDRQDLSGDARFVVFDDTAGGQVMLLDRDADGDGNFDLDPADPNQLTSLELISRTPAGEPGDGISHDGALSSDGRYIAYVTMAPNLLGSSPGEVCIDFGTRIGARNCQILLRDRFGGARQDEPVSVGTDSQFADGDSYSPDVALTPGGVPFVAFYSSSEDLVPQDASEDEDGGIPETDAFVRSFTPPLNGDPDPLDFGTQEVGQPPALMTAAFTNQGPGPIVIESQADDAYQVVRRDVTVPGRGSVRDSTICPDGTVVVGGGVQVVGEGTADFRTVIVGSTPGTINAGFNDVWAASLRNMDSVEHAVSIFALCADPPPGYQHVLREMPVEPGGFLRDTVACPAGTIVLAGGASVTREGSQDFGTVVQESSPGTADGASVWLVAVRNTDAVAHDIGISAVCANPLPGYQVIRQDFPVAAGGFLRDAAECPAGTVVLGGGAQVVGEGTADFHTLFQEATSGTGGSGSLYLVALRNDDTVAHTVGISAVCANQPARYQTLREDFTVPGSGFVRDTVECPAGTVVLGGGTQVVGEGTADFHTVVQESTPGTIGGGAQSLWLVALRNTDTVAHTIGIFAVCANAPVGYQIVRKDFAVGPGGFVREVADCPAGTVILGGGAAVVREGTADFRTVLQESNPSTTGADNHGVWLAAVRNNDTAPHTIGIQALCADPLPGYQSVREDFPVDAGGFVRDVADCPVGTQVLGGGTQVVGEGTADFHTVLQESTPGTTGADDHGVWLVALRNDDTVAHTIGIFAVCAVFSTGDGPEPVTIEGDDEFSITGSTCTPPERGRVILAPGETCEISVAFEPTAEDEFDATLTILYEDNPHITASTSPSTLPVRGSGGFPPDPLFTADPTTLNFGEQGIGQASAPQAVTVSVTGDAPTLVSPPEFTVTGVRLAGVFPADYRITGDTCSGRVVTPDTPCTVTIVHSPTAIGARPAVLEFTDTAIGGPTHLIAIEGSGAQPTLTVNPAVARAGGVVMATGTQWPPGTKVAITIDFLPAPINATVEPDGTFEQPVVIFDSSPFGPRKLNAAVVGNTTIALAQPQDLLVQARPVSPSDFRDR